MVEIWARSWLPGATARSRLRVLALALGQRTPVGRAYVLPSLILGFKAGNEIRTRDIQLGKLSVLGPIPRITFQNRDSLQVLRGQL